jgi:hypothetical protein
MTEPPLEFTRHISEGDQMTRQPAAFGSRRDDSSGEPPSDGVGSNRDPSAEVAYAATSYTFPFTLEL